MRVLLFTGKGGVGKTTTAAATAAHAAAHGAKTLVLSTDAAHSLGDALGVDVGADPTEVDTGLYAQQLDTQRAFEESWRVVQHFLREVLEQGGVDPIEAEELTVLPGADEVLALLEVRRQVGAGLWDVVVVDCAPTAETLRLLALPEALGWYLDRVFPVHRRVLPALRPVLTGLVGVPVPPDRVFAAVERLHADLSEIRALLVDPARTSIRLVVTPEAVVLAEARRTLTALSLHGYRVDGVVANRVLPDGADPFLRAWRGAQQAQLAELDATVRPLPVWTAPYQPVEPVGAAALAALAAELYDGGRDPLDAAPTPEPMRVEQLSPDEFVLALALPYADRDDVDVVRKGDELVVTVGAQRRVVALPSALCRCVTDGASLRDGSLRVRFRPDPDLWMRR